MTPSKQKPSIINRKVSQRKQRPDKPKQRPTTPKRKAPQNKQRPGKPKSRKNNKQKDELFPFMDLPPELRNLVYAEAASDQAAYLGKGTLTDGSALFRVSSQVHDEYLPILALHAKAIQTDVLDFDFRHIVTCVNRLAAAELNGLPSTAGPRANTEPRSIEITLRFANSVFWPDDYLLRRWLNRAGSTTKKGTMLDFQYTLVLSTEKRAVWGDGTTWAYWQWLRLLDNFVEGSTNWRAMEEARKMQAAFRGKT